VNGAVPVEHETLIQALESRLLSPDLKVQTAALEEAKKLVDGVSKAAVGGLEVTDNPFIYGDWLSRLGVSIIPELEGLYRRLGEGEAKTYSAILLLYLGSKAGLADVLEAVRPGNSCAVFASIKLGSAGVAEAAVPIENLLLRYASERQLDFPSLANLGSLIDALTKLGRPIPAEVRNRLTAPGVPKWVRQYLPEERGMTASQEEASQK
jgi:hypothetical protein